MLSFQVGFRLYITHNPKGNEFASIIVIHGKQCIQNQHKKICQAEIQNWRRGVEVWSLVENSWVSTVPVCVNRFSRTFLDQSTSKDFLYFLYHSIDLFFEGSSALFEIGVLPTTLQPLVKKVHYIHMRGLL